MKLHTHTSLMPQNERLYKKKYLLLYSCFKQQSNSEMIATKLQYEAVSKNRNNVKLKSKPGERGKEILIFYIRNRIKEILELSQTPRASYNL